MRKQIGAIGLIISTSVGSVALVLPILLSSLGILGALLWLTIFSCAMYVAGCLVFEVNHTLAPQTSYLSMAQATLGPIGLGFAWLSYMILLISLLAAYLLGLSGLTAEWLNFIGQSTHSYKLNVLPWLIITFVILWVGGRAVDQCNRFIVIGLIAAFCPLIVVLLLHSHPSYLMQQWSGDWLPSPLIYSVLMTSFGYQIVIPSLRSYLADQADRLPRLIAWGCAGTWLIYVLWMVVVILVVPVDGDQGMHWAVAQKNMVALLPQLLAAHVSTVGLSFAIASFETFALLGSFLAIAWSFLDFLSDGLKQFHWASPRYRLIVLTLLPAAFYAQCNPDGFVPALAYAGLFVAILNGLLPVMMSVAMRFQGTALTYRVPWVGLSWLLVSMLSGWVIIMQFRVS